MIFLQKEKKYSLKGKNKLLLALFSCFVFIQIINSQSTPGGIGTADMSLWVRGDVGVLDSGTLNWLDSSGLGNNAYQPTPAEKASQITPINFNNTFTFNGTSDRFAISNLNYTNGQSISELYAFVVYKTSFSSGAYNSNWSFIDFDRSESYNFYIHGNGRLAMSYESGGERDLVAATVSNNGLPHIGTFIFDNNVTNESKMRLDGFEDYSGNIVTSDINVTADRFGFIGDGSEASTANGTKNNIYYDGDIAEIILYDKGALTASEINKVESYLALKYGVTLNQTVSAYKNSANTTLWDNTTYWNDVAGIVSDSIAGAIHQKIALSATNNELLLATDNDYMSLNNDASRTSLTDGTSLLFGNNGNASEFEDFDVPNKEYIYKRKWLFKEVGETGIVFVAIPKTIMYAAGAGVTADLIVSADDVFDGTDTRHNLVEGVNYFYTSLNIADGERISFIATLKNYSPGGTGVPRLWYKGNAGVIDSGSSVTKVIDQAGNSNNLSQSAAANQPNSSGFTNFNPNLTFDGGNDRMPIESLSYTTADNLNQVFAWIVFTTDFVDTGHAGSAVDSKNWALLDFDRSDWFNATVGGDGKLGFSYKSGGIIDNKGVASANTGEPHLGGYIFDTNETNETKIRLNGIQEISVDNTAAPIHSNTTRFGYVGDGSESASFNSAGNNIYYDGSIAEIIYYENLSLDANDINGIESYLAIKYGITLNIASAQYIASDHSTILWNNSTYWNDVAGIGRDDTGGFKQKQSKSVNSDAILTIALGNKIVTNNTGVSSSFDNDLDFLLWGNDDGAVSEIIVTLPAVFNDCGTSHKGIERKWKVKNTGTIGDITAQFNVTGFTNPSEFRILIDEDGDGDLTTGTIREALNGVLTGNNLVFSNITLNENEVFSLVRTYPEPAITYEGGAWDGGNGVGSSVDNSTTDLTKIVMISEDVTLPTIANCKCLTIINNAKVTVENGKSLLVSDIINSNGSILLYGDSQLIQTKTGIDKNIGTNTAYRVLNEGHSSVYAYNYWSAPVNTEGSFNLSTNLKFNNDPLDIEDNTGTSFSGAFDGSGTTISTRWLFAFENSTTWNKISELTSLNPGYGFLMKGTGNTNLNFIGKLNNGAYTFPILTGNHSLLGNPYLSTIDADAFNSTHLASNVTTGVIYFWQQDSDDTHQAGQYSGGYATRISGVGTPAPGVIAPLTPTQYVSLGQGFFVEGGTSGGTITIDNSLRVYNNASLFLKSKEQKESASKSNNLQIIRIGFEFDEENKTYQRQIATVLRGLTMEKENGYDAQMFDVFENDIFWDLNDGSRYVITGIPYLEDQLEIPLGIVLEKQREVTIKLVDAENYDKEIYLKDNLSGNIRDLKLDEEKITLEKGVYTSRFSILLKEDSSLNIDEEVSKNDITLFYNSLQKELHVSSTKRVVQKLELYNLLGKKIIEKHNNSKEKRLRYSLKNLAPNVYVVKLITGDLVVLKKILVN